MDDRLKSKGVVLKLLNKTVDYASTNDIKINPLCPFAKSVFDKKQEEFKDVVKVSVEREMEVGK